MNPRSGLLQRALSCCAAFAVTVALLSGCSSDHRKDKPEPPKPTRAERIREYVKNLDQRVADLQRDQQYQQQQIEIASRELAIIKERLAAEGVSVAATKTTDTPRPDVKPPVAVPAPVRPDAVTATPAARPAAGDASKAPPPPPEGGRGWFAWFVFVAFGAFVGLYLYSLWQDEARGDAAAEADESAAPSDGLPEKTENFVPLRPHGAETAAEAEPAAAAPETAAAAQEPAEPTGPPPAADEGGFDETEAAAAGDDEAPPDGDDAAPAKRGRKKA